MYSAFACSILGNDKISCRTDKNSIIVIRIIYVDHL